MTTNTQWKIGLDGNWNTAGNWSAGKPNLDTDVFIYAAGDYTVTLGTSGFANSITMQAAGAIFREKPTGSLNIGSFYLGPGTAILNGSNIIGAGVLQAGGLLEVGNAGALGTEAYRIEGGEFLATASMTLSNQLKMSSAFTLAAAHGKILDLNGSSPWTLNNVLPAAVTFGDGVNDGTILWHTPVGSTLSNNGNLDIAVESGMLVAADHSFSFLFENATGLSIAAGATIDQAGFANVVSNLQGSGTIANSGAASTLSVSGASSFSGTIQGALALELVSGSLSLSGTNTYTGGTTVLAGATLQLGLGGSTGSVVGDILDDGLVIYDRNDALNQTIGISGSGSVVYEGGGEVTINRGESYNGSTTLIDSSASIKNSSALGFGALLLDNATLVANATMTLGTSSLTIDGVSSMAAAHGKTLTNLASGLSWLLGSSFASVTLVIGDTVNDGTVIWNTGAASAVSDSLEAILEVRGGTLRAGDSSFSLLTGNVAGVSVDAGATLDLAGFQGIINNLTGSGTVTGQAGATLDFVGNFAGVISGDLALVIEGGAFLSGNNTFSGGTTIKPFGVLVLGTGGTQGSVPGDIVDNGALYFDHSNNVTVTAGISGSGSLTQYGSGMTVINRAETYSGGTIILDGKLSIGEADAIGSGSVSIAGGELVTTAAFALSNALKLSGDSTIAAGDGTTLTLNTGFAWFLDASETASVTFGDVNHAGTIVWDTPLASSTSTSDYTVAVNAGVLRAGDSAFDLLTRAGVSTTVAAAGTLDLAGFDVSIVDLLGSGKVIDSGGASTLTIDNGNFSGALNGAISVDIEGIVTLSGGGTYTGGIQLESGATLNLTDTAARAVTFSDAGSLNISNASGMAETVDVTLFSGGGDVITGGSGNETINLGAGFTSADQVHGGSGNDTLSLNGDYTGANKLALHPTTLVNIETLELDAGHNYSVITQDATVAAGQTLRVDASTLGASNRLTFNGSEESDGHFRFTGGLGGDIFTGGALSDTFIYSSAGQSTSTHYDMIHGFDFSTDVFNTPGAPGTVTGIDASVSHTLSTGSFDTDLAAAVSGHLGAHTAMLVTANAGGLNGQVFLVVDLNGSAGYQSGADLVVRMEGAAGSLATSDFI